MHRYLGLVVCVLAFGCDDPDPRMDGGTDAMADGASDAGSSDVGADTSGIEDSGSEPEFCFGLSEATFDEPFAFLDRVTVGSRRWMRPAGEVCPAESLHDEPVLFIDYPFCNDTGVTATFRFGAIPASPGIRTFAVAYEGGTIPDDPRMCAFAKEGESEGGAGFVMTLEPGEVVTIVTTFVDPIESDATEVTTIAGPIE